MTKPKAIPVEIIAVDPDSAVGREILRLRSEVESGRKGRAVLEDLLGGTRRLIQKSECQIEDIVIRVKKARLGRVADLMWSLDSIVAHYEKRESKKDPHAEGKSAAELVRLHTLEHKLWGKGKDRSFYDKELWTEFDRLISNVCTQAAGSGWLANAQEVLKRESQTK